MEVGEEGDYISLLIAALLSVTTGLTPALRRAAMRAILD